MTSKSHKPQFVYVTYIASTPEKVWEGLTNPDFTEQFWAGRRLYSDWKVGSPVEARKGAKLDWRGEVLKFDPPKELSYTFDLSVNEVSPEVHSTSEGPSRVSFTLEPQGGVVKLTIRHEEFEEGSKVLEGVSQGWPALMSGLKTLIETGKGLPYDWKGR